MPPTGGGAVFITGTSTGIGEATAIHLAEQGFQVFAGVRRPQDGANLESRVAGELSPVIIEITDEASVAAAAGSVAEAVGERGLLGLVNNAGGVVPGPLEFQPLASFRAQLEMNLVGPLAVTQAFLPLIRRGAGRIVNVGSIGGRIALPLHGAYSASKFGMEALSDALRLELREWRIPVSLVDPGPTQSAIFGKTIAAIDAMEAGLGERERELYGEQIAAVRRLVEKSAEDPAPAEVLAKTIARALTTATPRSRYLAGKGANATALIARTLPDRLKDRAVARQVHLPKA